MKREVFASLALKWILQSFLLFHICLCGSLMAQNSARIDEDDRVPIGGSRPTIRMENDAGQADPHLPMRQMVLFLAPSPVSYEFGLASQVLPATQIDLPPLPSKRNPGRFVRMDQPMQAATTWLRSHGLVIDPTPNRLPAIQFHGTVAQVDEAFRVEIHNYVVGGRTYYANVNPPSVPRALAPSIRAVRLLDNLLVAASSNSSSSSEKLLHSFTGAYFGPVFGVVMDSAGNLYGTTASGGSSDNGSVFKLDTTGHETTLYSFTGVNGDGSQPNGSLVIDSAGNLYGTTIGGGANGWGIVFKLDSKGNESVLYSYMSTVGLGGSINGGLVMDSAGNLYGSTLADSVFGVDTVIKLDAKGNETVLYTFTGSGIDAPDPNGGLMDNAGSLYGTTVSGGSTRNGSVFKLDSNGNETDLYSFTGTNGDGSGPNGGLIMDSAGNLYGTASSGGSAGFGTVFKLDTTGHETTLYSFTGVNGDGSQPNGSLVIDSAGNLYGTTSSGGSAGVGTVFKVDITGHATVLYSFAGGAGDGSNPNGGLMMDNAGNLYGATYSGGSTGVGSVFKLDTTGHETVLFRFFTSGDGSGPNTNLVMDRGRNLYGTTSAGGSAGDGTVFKLDTNGNETVLYSFTGAKGDGIDPQGLIMDSAGNLYGTTSAGGSAGDGTVFKLDTNGNETVLYSFLPTNGDGFPPNAGLVMDEAGNLYGTTAQGGKSGSCSNGSVLAGCGTVFKVDANGNETTLYTFSGSNGDGIFPIGGLVKDKAGDLYGTTFGGGANNHGLVFRMDAKGNEATLYSFTSANGNPIGGLAMDTAGNLYGTTIGPVSTGVDTIFKLDAKGNETALYSFTRVGLSGGPFLLDGVGNLYGTTIDGGSAGYGTVFKLDTNGNETVLYNFTGTNGDGSSPTGDLITDGSGNLYGTTAQGGSANVGTVFEIVGVVADFSLKASAISPSSVVAGQSASSDMTIASLYGFNSGVTLTCSVSPKPALAPTCALSPPSVTPTANGTVLSTLTVSTTGASASATFPAQGRGASWYYALWLLFPATMLVGDISRSSKRRRGSGLFLIALLAAEVAAGVGCGGSSNTGSTKPGTPAGNYAITVTANSGSSITHLTTVTLTVQ